jgi:DNA-binding GntR family transcriptional regulator
VLARTLHKEIGAGVYRPGDQLPSERVLMELYDVARNTARVAIGILVREGLVRVEHGRGAYVQEPIERVRIEPARSGSFHDALRARGWTPAVVCAPVTHGPASAEIAGRLGVEVGVEVMVRASRCDVEGVPVGLAVAYAVWDVVAGSALGGVDDLNEDEVAGVWEGLGYRAGVVRDEIHARMATWTEVEGLRLRQAVPIIDQWTTLVTSDHDTYQTTHTITTADLITLTYTLPTTNEHQDNHDGQRGDDVDDQRRQTA